MIDRKGVKINTKNLKIIFFKSLDRPTHNKTVRLAKLRKHLFVF